ncbi:hypothetical protein HAZT_HAZT004185 [Hyalella azteca]|uniref:Uncharacterized protein n=1 Tax=Hyalella azteca TaxID=294128 RepID=A0A6A0HBA4_HYAAZ|nr:hypothetical protein HAZT_HAZT004185 [Hyalella azteca]
MDISDAQQWQAVHIPHNLQVAIREEDKNTAHPELFTTNFTDAHKLADDAYLVELNNVGSSCEVTVGSHHADCSSIHNLETDHHAGHITVTIQGQDPMYIHSTVNPDTSISYSNANTEMECSSHSPHSSKKEKIISSSKRKRRLMKPKKSCRPGAQSGIEMNSGGGTASSLKMEATSPNCDDAKYNPDEDGKDPRRSCRWYRQKYKKNWEKSKEFVGWLSPAPGDPSMAYCIACAKCLRGGMTHLKRHAETPYHKKRMIETLKMREIFLAKTVELRLSKFAHEFGLTDAAVAALPDLLKSIFPDNSLCKLLSDDRILTMLLVRKEESQPAAPSKLVSRKKSSQIVHSKPCKVNSHTSSEADAPAVIRFPCPEPEHCSHESSSGSQYNTQVYGDLDPMHTKYMPLEQHHQISIHPHPGSQAHPAPATVASSIISSNFSNCAMETRLETHQDVIQPCPEGAVSERYSVDAMDDTRPVMAEAGQARVPLPRVLVHHASNDTLTVRSYSFSPYHVYPSLFSFSDEDLIAVLPNNDFMSRKVAL